MSTRVGPTGLLLTFVALGLLGACSEDEATDDPIGGSSSPTTTSVPAKTFSEQESDHGTMLISDRSPASLLPLAVEVEEIGTQDGCAAVKISGVGWAIVAANSVESGEAWMASGGRSGVVKERDGLGVRPGLCPSVKFVVGQFS